MVRGFIPTGRARYYHYWILTHNGDIVLYLEERFMAALGQEAKGLTMGGGVERDPVHVQQTVPRTQGPLSDTHTHTHAHTHTRTYTHTHTHTHIDTRK